MRMNFNRTIVFVILFLGVACALGYAKSVLDSSRSVLDGTKQIVNTNKSVIDKSKTILNKSKKIIDDSKKVLDESKTVILIDNDGIGSYSFSYVNPYVNVVEDVYENIYVSVYQDSYINGYDKYLNTVVSKYPEARDSFVEYFSEWERSDRSDDFYSFAVNKAEYKRNLELAYDKALKKFGAGSAIVATTWVVSFVLPGGSILQTAMVIIAKEATKGAIAGAVSGGVCSVISGLLKGYSGEKLWYETVNGSANGCIIGAITGVIKGGVKVTKLAKSAETFNVDSEAKVIFDNKCYDVKGNYLGEYYGELEKVNGRQIINQNLVNQVNKNGIPYKYYLADDGEGHFFKVVNPDFTDVKIAEKLYHPPRSLWHDSDACINWCKQEYMKDLADSNVGKILGISKKEAAMRLQFEKGLDLTDTEFMKNNLLSKKEINSFLKVYDSGAWHHLPSSGEMIYVIKNHGQLAPHTGGDSFWGSKNVAEGIEW